MFIKARDIAVDMTITCGDLNLLPFCHITSNLSFEDIVNDGQLNGVSCPPLNSNAIFFFYGKPKYVPSEDAIDAIGGESPVCILFEYESIKDNDIAIFPFDSGGYSRYEAPKRLRIKDFMLCSAERTSDWSVYLRRYIKKMYGTNSRYLSVSLRNDIESEVERFHTSMKFVVELHDSIKSLRARKYGEQATSIEVQVQADSLKLAPKIIFLPISIFTKADSMNGDLRTPIKILEMIREAFCVNTIFYEDRPWSIGESYTYMRMEVDKYIRENYI